MRILGLAIVRADRLTDEYWRGFRLGYRSARQGAVSMLARPIDTGDIATARHILDDLASYDPTDLSGVTHDNAEA